jgi:hypothetical protein
MKTVLMLEDNDIVEPEDWCRPLSITSMNGGHSDHYSFKSEYTGAPENNVEWVKVKYILGKHWHNKTVSDIDSGLGKFVKYEYVRGDIPQRQQLDLRDYTVTDHTKVFYKSMGNETYKLVYSDDE